MVAAGVVRGMARKLRLQFEDACYHVINRGNDRRDIFAAEGTAQSFEMVVFEACARFGWRLHAYVIMRNHFPFALETPEPNLSVGMKWQQGSFAARFNRFHEETGRPFQGRFKALLVEPGHALASVAHYIHLNPVRARVVPPEQVAAYCWSSLARFLAKDRPTCLVADNTLLDAGGLEDTKAGWERYRQYLAWMATDPGVQKELKYTEMSRGWCVGTSEYRTALSKKLALRATELRRVEGAGREAAAWREVREAQWEEKLVKAARALRIDLKRLPSRKSAREKVVLAAALNVATGVSNGWLAERLAMGQPAGASQFVRRFRLEGGDKAADFQEALSRIKM